MALALRKSEFLPFFPTPITGPNASVGDRPNGRG